MTRRDAVALTFAGAYAWRARAAAPFSWPDKKRVAVSLTFDDARPSQIDVGVPVLDKHGAHATFYLTASNIPQRLDGWKKALARGHEMGNHSRTHPCTGNYRFSIDNALENYTRERMEKELDGCSADVEKLLGVRPVSFAYPCGQKFIGRGKTAESYVPLVAKRFLTGRGYMDEAANDPAICDLASLMGTPFDELTFDQMKKHVETAAAEGRWVVFIGHDIGQRGFQVTDAGDLGRLCAYANDPANGIWLDTVEKIGRYVAARQSG